MNFLFSKFQLRKLLLLTVDTTIVLVSCLAAFLIIGEDHIQFDRSFFTPSLLLLGCLTMSRLFFSTYNSIWRFADTREYSYLICADTIGFLAATLVGGFLLWAYASFLFLFITFMLSLVLVLCSRIIYKQLHHYNRHYERGHKDVSAIQIAIVGAGHAGTMLLEELQSSKTHEYAPYCFFDNDVLKSGSFIRGVKVYNLEKNMLNMLRSTPISEVVLAVPAITAEEQQRIVDICLEAGCKVKIYASPFERLNKNPGMDKSRKLNIRDINIEDLLSREPVSLDLELTLKLIHDKTVLITGGGGSIGSELCRQVLAMTPKKLVIVDIYENSTYEIQRELLANSELKTEVVVEIASIRDTQKMEHLFARHQPDVVFHAAAHKHVPLMEDSCDEAIKNNVFGTMNVVNAAERHGVQKFILISSDKAVNPTNVMGATKRIGEMIIQSKQDSKTEFTAVRFGNVLGSNGSVLPIFAKQIALGGPVTITDKRVNRFFMTISEAVQLVLQASAMAERAEIFVLDMGQPVQIYDLAQNMIKLAGLIPHKDIEIQEIGLRPGEKMYEELLTKNERLKQTSNEKIFVEHGEEISEKELLLKMARLKEALESMDNDTIRKGLKAVVPTYLNPENVNGAQEKTTALEMAKKINA